MTSAIDSPAARHNRALPPRGSFAARVGAQLRMVIAAALGLAILAACASAPMQMPPQQPQTRPELPPIPDMSQPGPMPEQPDPSQPDERGELMIPDAAQPYFNNRDGLTLPHMQGRDTKRLAILLPFSAPSERLRAEANAMFKAAELSLFDRESADTVLIALDTQGTEAGARSAAQAAMSQGADVILGPIIAGNVRAAAAAAARNGTPLLAFSNDQRAAGNGTYLLSFPPEDEVNRVVGYAAAQGITRFAYFGPADAYGRRVRAAYERAVEAAGGSITATETYVGGDISVMQEPAQRLADFYRKAEREARANRGLTPRAFEAVLLPEGGTALRSLAPLLPFYGIDPADVLLMGTSRWDDKDTVREPALNGGVFAAADKLSKPQFDAAFERAFGEKPGALSTLAYDAVAFGGFVADGDPRLRRERMESAAGFYGVDGFVRFDSRGTPERGLAIYAIQNGDIRVTDPAPRGPAPDS